MISFKEFLDEAVVKKWDYDKLSVEKAIAMLNEHCRDGLKAIDNKSIIWRGNSGSELGKFSIIDSSTGIRTSKDTTNLYQLMMDNSTALAAYPSRSKSFICSTDIDKAKSFAGYDSRKVYAFVPFDGTDIAVCDESDIFNTKFKTPFTRDINGADSFDIFVYRWLSGLGIKMKGQCTDMAFIDKKLAAISNKKLLESFTDNYFILSGYQLQGLFKLVNANPSKRMTALSNILCTPKTMSLKLIKYGKKLPIQCEVWFSGKAVVIRKDLMDNILKVIKKEKKDGIREEVNDKIFYTDFKKEKEILGGEYKLTASAGYVGYGAKPGFKSNQFRIVAKTAKGAEVGWVNFEKHDDHLEALDLSIQPAHRRKGIATEMYKLARECGNDVAPSKLQTGMGKTFWNKDHSK